MLVARRHFRAFDRRDLVFAPVSRPLHAPITLVRGHDILLGHREPILATPTASLSPRAIYIV
jgi:hypothetical protein